MTTSERDLGADPFEGLQPLLAVLEAHPEGLSEYDFFRALAARGERTYDRGAFTDSLALFQAHFLLFHQLYRLRDLLRGAGRGHLEISCLRIALSTHDTTPLPQGAHVLSEVDPLRRYYLDLENLRRTTREDIDAMLSAFWTRFGALDERAAALRTLELENPVDFVTIKKQYRRLAFAHHPDRGGDKERLSAINEAMSVLTRHHAGRPSVDETRPGSSREAGESPRTRRR